MKLKTDENFLNRSQRAANHQSSDANEDYRI